MQQNAYIINLKMAAARFYSVSSQAMRALATSLPTWSVANSQDFVTRTFQFENQIGTFDFLNLVSNAADKYERYPEWRMENNEVTVKIQYKEGIDDSDLKLAKFMDKAEEHINRVDDL